MKNNIFGRFMAYTRRKILSLLLWWNNTRVGDKIQFFLLVLNIIMIAAFIYFSQKQIENTQETLEKTQRSIEIAKINSEIELRAYIMIVTANIDEMSVGKNLGITITYENTGLTPAYNVRPKITIKPGGKGIYENDWLNFEERSDEMSALIGPRAVIKFPVSTDITIRKESDIIGWKSGAKFLGVFGYIFYEDIFGDSCFTQFCMYYEYKEDKFVFNEKYNNADRNLKPDYVNTTILNIKE